MYIGNAFPPNMSGRYGDAFGVGDTFGRYGGDMFGWYVGDGVKRGDISYGSCLIADCGIFKRFPCAPSGEPLWLEIKHTLDNSKS